MKQRQAALEACLASLLICYWKIISVQEDAVFSENSEWTRGPHLLEVGRHLLDQNKVPSPQDAHQWRQHSQEGGSPRMGSLSFAAVKSLFPISEKICKPKVKPPSTQRVSPAT